MVKSVKLYLILFFTISSYAQKNYVKTFGDKKNHSIIFLHGGPGYNSVNFEATTAKNLSDNGFFVIVYDRRGEGRSSKNLAKFTFKETFDDINSIYNRFNLKSATLLGHSFGGIIAIFFAEKHPDKIKSIVLTGVPISMQETFSTILKSSKTIYQNTKDNVNLNYIKILEKMDKSSIEFSSYCFSHAMQNGFYYPKKPTEKALNMYAKFKTDSLLIKYVSKMSYQAPKGFWENENYTTLNLNSNLKNIINHGIKVFGIYGKDDGLFSEKQINKIQNNIGKTNFEYLENCSHNTFIDRQTKFISLLKKWVL